MATVPVYIATGFLESGKTSFIKEIVYDDDFTEGLKSLIICCEQGEEPYDPIELNKHNSQVVYVDKEDDLDKDYFEYLRKIYKPKLAFIEYNGTWSMDKLFGRIPRTWPIVQIFTNINAQTFDIYLANMQAMMFDHLKFSDCVIVNRCSEQTDKGMIRRKVKAQVNGVSEIPGRINILFENVEGYEDDDDGTGLPYDYSRDKIEIDADDFGIWFIDLQENQERYVGKTIDISMYAYKDADMPDGFFYAGRHVNTCCANDIRFLGLMVRFKDSADIGSKKFYHVTGKLSIEENPMYKFAGPVLTADKVTEEEEPKGQVVYL